MAADPIVAECADGGSTVEIEIDGAPISDANPLPVDVVAGSISIDPGDIEIGAVEIKSATNDNRAEVDLPANVTGADLVLGVHDPGPVNNQAADGVAVAGNPVRIGGKDGSGNTQDMITDTAGNQTAVGNVASGVADSGAPVKIGGVNRTVLPTLADGQRGDAQLDTAARLIVTLGTLLGGEDLTNALIGVLMKPVSSATYSPSNNKDAGTVTKANAKAAPGNVYSFRVSNANAAVRYFQLHDKASAPAAAETASRFFVIPGGTAAQPSVVEIPSSYLAPSWRLGTGVSWAISTTAAAFTDAATAADHTVDLSFV